MIEGIIFGIVFVAFFVIRGVAATIFFYYVLPQDGRCPCCNAPTARVQSTWFNKLLPWFRTSWCYECGWEGLLRHEEGGGEGTREPEVRRTTELPPHVGSGARPID
jgi:hypothetical protein